MPTSIVRSIRTSTQNLLEPLVPKRWIHLFQFGLQSYGIREFASAASNARMVNANAHTASSHAFRLLSNLRLADHLGIIFDGLKLIRPSSFVNVDHSEMNGLLALVAAVQTRKGRALPCMVEGTYSESLSARDDAPPREQALRKAWREARRWQCFTGHVIDSLQGLADRLGFWPKLVFDRGFGNYSLVTHLAAEGAIFYIRLKAGRYVELDGERVAVQQLKAHDATVELFGLQLRIIRSPQSRRAKEPWYILTNDFTSSRDKIVRIYYHRFEIEETFKDEKHVFNLKKATLNQPNSLKVILWFMALGLALLYVATQPTKQAIATGHPKKQRSWVRQAYEKLQREMSVFLWEAG